MIVGVAGHSEHGKTALVTALTGAAPRKPGGAVDDAGDFGVGWLDAGGGAPICFIDFPGRNCCVRNMAAGAAGVDFVLLVVDVCEGPKPQTIEHLRILELLGVRRGVVALGKCDLAGADRVAGAAARTRARLRGTVLAEAQFVPMSALTGEGVEALRRALREAAAENGDGARPGADAGRLRIAVDGSFGASGEGAAVTGTVVTGTVLAGSVRVGDTVMLSPQGVELRVRGLHAQGSVAGEARKGDRCALDLAGPGLDGDAARRGDWIVAPEAHAPIMRFDARMGLLAEERWPLGHWRRVRLHLAAGDVGARLALLEGAPLKPGEEACVQIAAERPICALHGDRFVIRDQSGTRTIGGGRVLDPFPLHHERRSPERLAILAAEARDDAAEIVAARLALPPRWLNLDRFMLAHNMTEAPLQVAEGADAVAWAGAFVFARGVWDDMKREVVERLEAFHQAFPSLPGLEAEKLASSLSLRPPMAALAALLAELSQQGAVHEDRPWLRLAGHCRPAGKGGGDGLEDEGVWAAAAPRLAAHRFNPPRVRDLSRETGVPEERVRELMQRLAGAGKVVEVAHDHFFLREAVTELIGEAEAVSAGAEEEGGCFRAAEFRDRIGVGRKVAIQILEFFDRRGVTERNGDLRRMRTRPGRRSR